MSVWDDSYHRPVYLLDNEPMYPACPCPRTSFRRLDENFNEQDGNKTWEIVYTCTVLFFMFAALISDRIGADSVMLSALTAFAAAEIISLPEALVGFSNQGLLTVMVLFVVAEGISKTGALDWYMGKLLGKPNTPASAQLRLMVPIAAVSAFLNNTPVVAVMIPIVLRWAKTCKLSAQQLLVPLSFASILGGTCTLIGTSTNLVVVGLLDERYRDDDSISIGLFDLGQYGVPVAMAGIAYVIVASPVLLPGARPNNKRQTAAAAMDNDEDLLLGARLTQWSPAAGRTVRRSGLRETGGIYLVSVHRAATGNVHRAVSQDFVLQVGDILYFTGLVEGFGDFCNEHGLEVLTNEVQDEQQTTTHDLTPLPSTDDEVLSVMKDAPRLLDSQAILTPITEDDLPIPAEIGVTKESLLQSDSEERIRSIHRMTDMIRNAPLLNAAQQHHHHHHQQQNESTVRNRTPRRIMVEGVAGKDPAKIVVTIEKDLVVVGINAHDRVGLLLDISKGLLRLQLELHHTEAAVVAERSISVWRCQPVGVDLPDLEEIWSVMNALLSTDSGVEAVKQRGLRVIRARVVSGSRLIGQTAGEVNFRQAYKAAIVAIQKVNGGNVSTNLSQVRLDDGDVLILQASDDSPLLVVPPTDFYKNLEDSQNGVQRQTVATTFVNLIRRRSSGNLESMVAAGVSSTSDSEPPRQLESQPPEESGDLGMVCDSDDNMPMLDEEAQTTSQLEASNGVTGPLANSETFRQTQLDKVWRDLEFLFPDETSNRGEIAQREFLTAMAVAPGSKLAGKTVAQVGINKLPEMFLVSIDRPVQEEPAQGTGRRSLSGPSSHADESEREPEGSVRTDNIVFKTIDPAENLQEGDVLWFSGSASAVGDLRKIPGLVSYQNEEVLKINEKVFDRRLVQAVIARKGPLVGKTVKEVRFRTRFGAAVIAVHREGQRVHELPGRIKLQAGDVLLLEAGPTFIGRSSDNDRSFALLAEVENSAPPRLSLLIPALVITAGMLIVFTAKLTSLLISALVAAVLMVLLGILSEQEARDAVNWDVYITIAAAFGIGTALVNSGVAEAIANFLVDVGTAVGIGDAGLYGAVYFATFLISNVVTNNAAAALLFPIAMDAAEKTGTDRILMSYALMLGASASFMSPFGYTTNLLIYGPGGYKYRDFLAFGTPMQIVLWILSVLVLVIEPWYISWIVTGMALLFVSLSRVANSSVSSLFRGQINQKDKTEQR